MNKASLLAITALAVTSMACGFTINIPVDRIITEPTQIEEINLPAPDVDLVNLVLNFGAGDLLLKSGAKAELVSGTAAYNVPDFKPKIRVEADKVRLETGNLNIQGIPNFDQNIQNKWDLKLGDQPMELKINSGAYRGNFDLGGLSLKSLEVNDGAAEVHLKFSQPNQVEMESLRYITGASTVRLSNLANANFTSMIFRSGAGDYTLDFSGKLQRDAVVTIESGFSQVVIIVPEENSAKVLFKGGLTNVDISGGWKKSGNAYILGNSRPLITINIDLGAGNLALRTN